MRVDIQGEIAFLGSQGLLKELLADKTTKKNIIWATDAYSALGDDYLPGRPIETRHLSLLDSDIITLRAQKARSEQNKRTRAKAEVFTPSWVCRMMIDHLDTVWKEGRKRKKAEHAWDAGSWHAYVDSRILEITCGEAPFLVERYDAATGEAVEKGAGVLDRKLDAVDARAENDEKWLEWAFRALEAVYGYEYQGDNLLIARLNVIFAFAERLRRRLKREPKTEEYRRMTETAAWNLWQMDGLTGRTPYFPPPGQIGFEQILSGDAPGEGEECKVKNHRQNCTHSFNRLKEREKHMVKFDFIIGNPPYQETSQGDKPADEAIFHYFMDAAYAIADNVELITPARFLFNAGNTPQAWNQKMLADKHLKVLYYTPNASEVFRNAGFKGGIAITYRNEKKEYGAIEVFTAFPELNSILNKVKFKGFSSLSDIIYSQNKFNLTTLYNDYPHLKSIISSNGNEKRLTSGCFEKMDCFSTEKIRVDDISILGLLQGKRVYRYIKKEYLELEHENLYKYKVILPANNGSGAIGEVLSTPLIGEPLIGYTQTFISVGSFDSLETASNALKYIKSKFARAMLGILKITQNGKKPVWKYVPLQDFTPSSDIDWSKSIAEIDRQLYKKYGLDESEIEFIETHVKEMN